MSDDASFADSAGAGPLRLWATEAGDLQVISALVQDAVLPASEMRWSKGRREVAFLLNRFRWEGRTRPPQRVRSVLTVTEARGVRGQGVVPGDAETVLSLLALEWQPGADAEGQLRLTFAGDGVVEIDCECLDVTLRDVTQPYLAPSGKVPDHPE
ncbi:hypothetical protein JSE7799_00465 [Jannaschia seosinensis]|uniref:DUF2948 domain-containing protein n=1 Tax=Jannaschia seosinensis TaxID=313367 RepID=A0A0M7B6T4_9RHOB|nr:DUF2948 family protein [Jannaschia seosinensis]CUH19174.1 hypothetical protein JSE7799_00465 [Jannaschia seosinensis]